VHKVQKLATSILHKLKTQSLTRFFQFSKLFNKLIGLPDWEKYTNHCWRQYGISRVVNNPNSNPAETRRFARHASITSQLPYNRPHGEANAAFQTAINPSFSGAKLATRSRRVFSTGGKKNKKTPVKLKKPFVKASVLRSKTFFKSKKPLVKKNVRIAARVKNGLAKKHLGV
jgi:uncharacterized short protein YbdD (DUF466 family)